MPAPGVTLGPMMARLCMMRLWMIRLGVALAWLWLLPVGAAAAAPPAPPPLQPAQAQAALAVLQNPAQRAALENVLRALAAGQKPPPASAPVALPVRPNSLLLALLSSAERLTEHLSDQLVLTARAVTDFPLLWYWITATATNPVARAHLADTLLRAGLGLALAALFSWLAGRALRPTRARVRGRAAQAEHLIAEHYLADHPEAGHAEAGHTLARMPRLRGAAQLLRRVPWALLWLLLALLPLVAFAVSVVAADGLLATQPAARLVLRVVAGPWIAGGALLVGLDTLLAPARPQLRLVAVSDRIAAILAMWLRRAVVAAVLGVAIASVGQALGLYAGAHEALLRLTSLVVDLCFVGLILRLRAPVAAWLRGLPGGVGILPQLRRRLAAIWHWVMVAALLGLWLVYAVELRGGIEILVRFLLLSLLVLIGARLLAILLLGGLDRTLRAAAAQPHAPGLLARIALYGPPLRGLIQLVVAAATLVGLLQVWGLPALYWFAPGALGGRVMAVIIRLGIAVAVAVLIWEMASSGLSRQMARLEAEGQPLRAARLRTLEPMLRTVLLSAVLAVLVLMGLSQIGVDIAPLLAGAGIIGVAIGFGSQKLVQDLITGIFLLLENAMQVGDWVTAGGLSGSVEHLSIRTLRLRATDGSVHIIPFSAVTTVTNSNRGIGNVPVKVEVEPDQDIQAVCDGIAAVVAGLRADPAFAAMIIGDLVLWGVDQVTATMVAIVGQIPCTDGGRWSVQREFNRRLKAAFDAAGIRLAAPVQSWALRHPLDVRLMGDAGGGKTGDARTGDGKTGSGKTEGTA